jgi:hydrogenase nickel incorporation protein HypA/HybF
MHELSVCIALLEQVERIAKERCASNVARIVIKLGPLSGVEPELLLRSYPIAASGTVAEHAELAIDRSDVVVRCSQCDAETAALPNRLLCGECGDFRTRIVSGDEMILQSVELRPAAAPLLDTA